MQKATSGASAAFIALGAAAVVGITKALDATVHLAREVKGLQRVTGQSAESASALIAVGASFGVTVDQMGVAFGLLDKNVANNSAKLKQYGLTLRNAQGDVLPFDKQLSILADKFESLPTAQEKAAFAMNLFGRSGKTMIPILAQGAAGIEEMKLKAKDLGVVLGEDAVDSALKLSRAEREFGESIKGAAVSIGTSFLPVATELVTWVTGAVEAFTRLPSFVKAGTLSFFALTGALIGLVKLAKIFAGIWAPIAKAISTAAVAAYGYVTSLVSLATTEGIVATASFALEGAMVAFAATLGPLILVVGSLTAAYLILTRDMNQFGQDIAAKVTPGFVKLSDAMKLSQGLGISLGKAFDILAAAEKRQAAATDLSTQALKDQRAAEQALAGGLLGIVTSLRDVRDNQHEVNKLRRDGKTNTRAYRDAETALLQSQLGLDGSMGDLITTMKQHNLTAAEARDKVFHIGKQAGLTAAETRNVLAPALKLIRDKYGEIPKNVKTKVTVDDQATGAINRIWGHLAELAAHQLTVRIDVHSGPVLGHAAGGILKAAQGFVTNGPVLVGEASTPTFAGRGAEGVIPFDHRGIGILSQALEKAGAGGHGRLMLVQGQLSIDESGHAFIRGIARQEVDDQSAHDRNLSRMA